MQLLLLCRLFVYCNDPERVTAKQAEFKIEEAPLKYVFPRDSTILDTVEYNRKLLQLAHNKPSQKWPVKTVYPLNGAILPFKRIVAFYGNREILNLYPQPIYIQYQ